MHMNIKALITTLAIVGSSSAAMARPATVSVSANAQASLSWGTSRPVIRDHRTPSNVYPVRSATHEWTDREYDYNPYFSAPRFKTLDADLQFGDTEYRKDIVLGGTKGRFNTLQIEADSGRTYIMKVVVEFSDATFQQIDLNKTLRSGDDVTLDLAGSNRSINRILIYRADGAPALSMNQPHFGEFSVLAL